MGRWGWGGRVERDTHRHKNRTEHILLISYEVFVPLEFHLRFVFTLITTKPIPLISYEVFVQLEFYHNFVFSLITTKRILLISYEVFVQLKFHLSFVFTLIPTKLIPLISYVVFFSVGILSQVCIHTNHNQTYSLNIL